MKTSTGIKAIAATLALCLALGAAETAGAQVNAKLKPGYVDFDAADFLDGRDMTVEIMIEGPVIRAMVKGIRKVEPKMADLLDGLFQIRINVFSLKEIGSAAVREKVAKVEKDLDEKGWNRVVRVRDGGEMVDMYLKFGRNDVVQGMVVFVIEDGGEAVFINIVGEMDPEKFGEVAAMFMGEGDIGDLFENFGETRAEDEEDDEEDDDGEDEDDDDEEEEDEDEDEDDDDEETT